MRKCIGWQSFEINFKNLQYEEMVDWRENFDIFRYYYYKIY
jgi:hypothetical protein